MKRELIHVSLGVAVCASLLAFFSSCNSSDAPAAGPIDGNYTFTGWTCGAKNVLTGANLGSVKLNLTNGTGAGSLTLASNANCTATTENTFAYPSSNTITEYYGALSCGAGCSGLECQNQAASSNPNTYSYQTASGTVNTTVTFTRTLTQQNINDSAFLSLTGCGVGTTETITATK
jgi:hypothetical protein